MKSVMVNIPVKHTISGGVQTLSLSVVSVETILPLRFVTLAVVLQSSDPHNLDHSQNRSDHILGVQISSSPNDCHNLSYTFGLTSLVDNSGTTPRNHLVIFGSMCQLFNSSKTITLCH